MSFSEKLDTMNRRMVTYKGRKGYLMNSYTVPGGIAMTIEMADTHEILDVSMGALMQKPA